MLQVFSPNQYKMLQIHTKLSQIAQKFAKLPKTDEPTTFLEFYNLIPYADREYFKEEMKSIMGWSEQQWRNRIYKRTAIVQAEITLLEIITGQEHKL